MLNKQKFLALIIIGFLLLSVTPSIAKETTNHSTTRNETTVTRVVFTPPEEDKSPEKTGGGGSRNDLRCPQDTETHTSLTLLVPVSYFGLTVTERPFLWTYIPETSARQVVLSIREQDTKKHHSHRFFPITGESGIFGFQPSQDSPPLEIGKTYEWAMVLVCGQKPTPNDPASSAWIQRIASPQPVHQGTDLEQAAQYGEQGIWYDMLTYFIRAKQLEPDNKELMSNWVELLESTGLEMFIVKFSKN
ncbi:DUF928 domain-containing protein [Gloeocapsa sp. PCC 73106]|uniref:DUF928 domain-containing protein n=1 Tax=Gloeocapsa sp. PCC 73106 TaxID=102232 RepID=UPI0002AC8C0A|nr:DUF928 domain-containing protein [Gloeocapsa sp. PCC 73106]ELR99024.1 protein of unknown function (DUF928) [Gloeocapsa sp. PCC 73106]